MNSSDQPTDIPPGRKSPAALAGDVLRHGSSLIEQEVQLAKAEVGEKLNRLKAAVGEILAGTVMIVVSLGILLSALVSGVARLLVAIFAEETLVNDAAIDASRTLPTYEGIAALLIGTLFAVIGALLLRNGFEKFDPDNLVPERTVRQARRTGDMVQDET